MPSVGLLVDLSWLRRVSEFEAMAIETSQTEKQQRFEKSWEKWNRISKNCGTTIKGVTYP